MLISVISVHDEPLYCSTFVDLGLPPARKAAVCIPVPATSYAALFKSPDSVQELPSHSSVIPTAPPEYPPKIKPDVLDPAVELHKFSLAVFISAISVQLEPFHNSTLA